MGFSENRHSSRGRELHGKPDRLREPQRNGKRPLQPERERDGRVSGVYGGFRHKFERHPERVRGGPCGKYRLDECRLFVLLCWKRSGERDDRGVSGVRLEL